MILSKSFSGGSGGSGGASGSGSGGDRKRPLPYLAILGGIASMRDRMSV